jgi:hypothetical protein
VSEHRSEPANPVPRGPYSEWWWPDPPLSGGVRGWSSFEHRLVPEVDPGPESTYFWAHQFQLEDGEGGYLGLQTRGNRADGTVGKIAIFSLWGATGAVGRSVVRFTGEGIGWSTRITYPWAAGRTYQLRLEASEVTPEGAWWTAWVADVERGDEDRIGVLRGAPGWGRLGTWSVMWTEYYGGPLQRCSDLPHVSATFSVPRADGAVLPARANHYVGNGTCDTTRITELDDAVRQEMGVPE